MAERSGDTAFISRGAEASTAEGRYAGRQSGVALRFPPQSKSAPLHTGRAGSFPARACHSALALVLALLAIPFFARADSLTTLDGKSFTGKISVEPAAFVVTAADASVQRVPLADVRGAAFDRKTFAAKPAEWTGHSVGPLPATGSFTQSNGVFLITGAGTAWSVDDGHYFVQQDVGETARLTAFVPPQVGTRGGAERYKVAGLALLGRCDAAGPAYYIFSEGAKSGLTRWRSATGKERSKHFTTGAQGAWLRLELCGQQVTAFASDDGLAWRQVGNEVIAFPELAHAGLLVTGAKKGVPASVAFSHVELLHADAPSAPLPQLRLCDGGVLAGKFLGTDGSVVRWHALGREWRVSLVNVSRLVLDPRGGAASARLAGDRPGALLASGDFVDGELVGGTEGRITISSVLFGLKNYSAEGAVLAVHVRDVVEAATEFEVLSADGSRLLASQLELRAEGVAGRERSAGEFLLRVADVSDLRRLPSPARQ
ncbi:MAG: hypothetical protein FD161_925 [Limisphaerales bacterium]|nr:MAG: hypothetical protein FD161_925 [Limisphaerales bacterium]KAG0509907.1 MAG: hypothetical protein E1N63_925 [Limisphaerales bacterium]TXT50622.1 MAG: hypothetical protein FD140_2254 [Limisphaerales bacterium]